MKAYITTSLCVTGMSALVSCTSLKHTCSIETLLPDESLRIIEHHTQTNDIGYFVSMALIDANNTNRVFNAWLDVVDLDKDRAKNIRESKRQSDEERQRWHRSQTDTNLHLRVGSSRVRDSGWITHAWAIESDLVKNRFPHYKIFSVGCLSGTGNPVFIAQPLLIGTNDSPIAGANIFILGNAPTVAAFITEQKSPVRTLNEARETLALFCELQSWTTSESMPDEVSDWTDAKDPEWVSKWTYRETETNDGWSFQAVFLTDPAPFIRSYYYYEIDVLRDGSIILLNGKDMGARGGYI
jgi:hypothetical protein